MLLLRSPGAGVDGKRADHRREKRDDGSSNGRIWIQRCYRAWPPSELLKEVEFIHADVASPHPQLLSMLPGA